MKPHLFAAFCQLLTPVGCPGIHLTSPLEQQVILLDVPVIGLPVTITRGATLDSSCTVPGGITAS